MKAPAPRALAPRAPAPPRPPRAPRADLHLHTARSDGELPVDIVLGRAAAAGLELLALTDHDTAAFPEGGAWLSPEGRTLRVLAAAEVSGAHAGHELHLLVYFPGPMPAAYRAFLEERRRWRWERYCRALDVVGADTVERPAFDAQTPSLTRHHLARALTAHGVAPSFHGALKLLAARQALLPLELPYVEVIRGARAAGAVTVWAHPGLPEAQAWAATFAAAGLHGLEAFRPANSTAVRNGLKRVAARNGLFASGGSDWHGWGALGPGLFQLPEEYLAPFLGHLDG